MDFVIVAVIAVVVLYVLYQHGKLSGVIAKLKAYEDQIVPGLKDQLAAAGNPVIKVVGVPVAPKADVVVAAPVAQPLPQIQTPAPVAQPAPVKVVAARDINVEEPLIAEWDAKFNASQGAHMLTQMATFYCAHPELGPLDYAQVYQRVVVNHEGRTGDDLKNAIGQDARSLAAATVAGLNFNGSVPISMMREFKDHLADGLFVSVLAGEFNAKVGRNIWEDTFYGTDDEVNAFINFVESTNAGAIGTFNVSAYNGMLKDIVTRKMNGG